MRSSALKEMIEDDLVRWRERGSLFWRADVYIYSTLQRGNRVDDSHIHYCSVCRLRCITEAVKFNFVIVWVPIHLGMRISHSFNCSSRYRVLQRREINRVAESVVASVPAAHEVIDVKVFQYSFSRHRIISTIIVSYLLHCLDREIWSRSCTESDTGGIVDNSYLRGFLVITNNSVVRSAMNPDWSKTGALLLLLSLSSITAAPVANEQNDGSENKSDVPVEQLEKLKLAESNGESLNHEHVEFHRLDAVKANGELVSRLEQHASADSSGNGAPQVHSQSQLDVPSEGVHRVVVQDGAHVSVIDGTATASPSEEPTTKVFHGAARLVQHGSAPSPQNGHTAVRRAFNADLSKETKNNMDHYSSYSGVQYSPLDMAEYVFWTGDENKVTSAIEEFLQEGLMSKEEAITFLQEIKFNIDYLRAHYSQNLRAAEETAQQERLRNMLMEQASIKDYQNRSPALQSFPFGGRQDIIHSIASKNWELSNNLSPLGPMLPVPSDLRPEPVKRYDPMLQTNIISTSDYDRDGQQIVSEEEYEEMMDKLKAADTLYTEYTLEEIIYQLAKMMFSQSLSRDPASARAATQRFMAFLELEAERGQLSRTIEKKVLDVMIAALTDTIGDHPELLQTHETVNPANRILRQFLEASSSEPSMSRAILAAYKDELLKGPPLHKFAFDRN